MTLRRFALMAAIALAPGNGPAAAQAALPAFFDGMALLEINDCPSFTVSYYATPAISRAQLDDDGEEIGFGFAVMPKPGVRLTSVQTASTEPEVDSVNYIITFAAPGQVARDITAKAHDHAAPPEAAMIPSPLFGEGGVFYAGGSYRDILAFRTNGDFGRGTVVIDERAAQIFRGSDGSTCTIRVPQVRFQIR